MGSARRRGRRRPLGTPRVVRRTVAPESATGREGRRWPSPPPSGAAMRRALDLAAHARRSARAEPACGLRAARRRRRRGRRGLPPRRGYAARRGRRARPGRRCRPRHHRRGHPRAVQPHRPHRPVRRAPDRRRRTPGRVRAAGPQPGRRRGRAGAARRPGSRSRAACWSTRPARSTGLDVRRRPRPAVRHLEVRHHARRPQRRRRRHQPLGHQPRRRGATPTGSGRSATRCWSAPARSRSTTRS